MSDTLDAFLAEMPEDLSSGQQIDYFVYYLTEFQGQTAASPADVESCFENAHLVPYSNVSAYLTRNSKGKRRRFLKKGKGRYVLERNHKDNIARSLRAAPGQQQAAELLEELLSQVVDDAERSFLKEAIQCFKVKAMRAAIVMTWNMAVHHLRRYILHNELSSFNAALAKETDNRVKKIAAAGIGTMDDFGEVPEGKFVELARAGGIISKDVRKKLDMHLGTRNTYAHPSNVDINDVTAAAFIIDLVQNVILKYEV